MIRFKDIHIPKPCSVDYDALPGDNVKRFCSSCKKQVYDFRGKDEVYFNSIIKSQGKVCGFFYEGQIKQTPKISNRLLHSIWVKLFSISLFLKSFTSSAEYGDHPKTPFTQSTVENDSIGIKTKFKNEPTVNADYHISIYIDDKLYQSNIDIRNGYIYLPDTIKNNQKIKIVVHKYIITRHLKKPFYIKPKLYIFTFDQSDKIVVKIKYKKQFTLFRKRIRSYGGTFTL
jgi:hypothetical protein